MYSLEVYVHNTPITKYIHQNNVFVEGREGSEYTIRFFNHTASRVLAVISVDGLSIVDGEKASYTSSGYVVDPNNSLDVPGWRLDDEAVAKFVFGSRKKSYAAKKGIPQDIGVIGCAVFTEKQYFLTIPYIPYTEPWLDTKPHNYWYDTHTICRNANYITFSNSVNNINNVEVSSSNIGTIFGEEQNHKVMDVSFERNELPVEVIEIQYDDRKGLESRGIYLGKVKARVARAFPNEPKYCKPPQGWRRTIH